MNKGKPSFYFDREPLDLSSLTVEVVQDGNTYDAGEILLTPGTYGLKAKKGLEIVTKEFKVVESSPVLASEGNGYKTLTEEEVAASRLGNVPYSGALGVGKMPSLGKVNVLVLPVTFKGGASLTEKELSSIKAAYFGEKEETGWESLKTYYEKSSYGKLELGGVVASPYVSTLTEEELIKFDGIGIWETIDGAVESAVKNDGVKLQDYDADHDGYIDAIEVVYKAVHTYSETRNTLFWNFTSYLDGNLPDVENPAPYRYFWSNVSEINSGYYSTDIDAHTLVHETGHMFGLNDYYNYEGTSSPCGGADMMDMNIGDHNAYSKYLLGWVTPKVVDGTLEDFEITLSAFQDSGDCLLLRNQESDSFNGTPYDEYLMLSYYTPTGLNEEDVSYASWSRYGTGGTYSYSGLIIHHIDERLYSRVGSLYEDGKVTEGVYQYSEDPLNTDFVVEEGKIVSDYGFQASFNTPNRGKAVEDGELLSRGDYECTIIPASGGDWLFMNKDGRSNLGSTSALMGLSEYGCRYNGYSNYKMKDLFDDVGTFNDGSLFPYDFSVTDQSESSITIHFVKG